MDNKSSGKETLGGRNSESANIPDPVFSGSCPAVQCTGSSPRRLSPFCDGDKCQTTHSQAREHLCCLGNRAPRDQPARGQGMVLSPSRHSFWRGVAKIHSSGSMWGLVPPCITMWGQWGQCGKATESQTPGEVNSSVHAPVPIQYNPFLQLWSLCVCVCVYLSESD